MAYEFWNKSEDPPLALLPVFLNSWMQQLPYWTRRLLSSPLVALSLPLITPAQGSPVTQESLHSVPF